MEIWSVGHSNHRWEKFAELLTAAGIKEIADIRSSPTSRFPHFSQAAMRDRLESLGTSYVYLGSELGGKSLRSYTLAAREPLFHIGIEQLLTRARVSRLSILCSEHDPFQCHRFLLVGRHLFERGIRMLHILRDGRIESHEELEARLLVRIRASASLFNSGEDQRSEAYRQQAKRLGLEG